MRGVEILLVLFFLNKRVFPLSCPTAENMDAEVLVFGAGVSGMTIAKSLYESGIEDIQVLEARSDSFGGRVRSTNFTGYTIELGANWIQQVFEQESKRNLHPIWKLAKNTPGCADLEGGFSLTDEFWSKAPNEMYSVLNREPVDEAQDAYNTANEKVESLNEMRQANNLDDITFRQALQIEGWTPETALENLTEWYNFDFCFAETPNASSLYASIPILEHDGLGEEDYFISDQRGFATFLDCVVDGIKSKIQLGAMVNNISWNTDCVCASVTINNQERTMCGKYGVVTFSIGVLQEWLKSSKFNPPPSAEKQEAIRNSRMAHYLKIFLRFNESFWNTDVDYILRVDEERGRFPIIQPVGALFPGSPAIILVTVVDSEAVRLSLQDPEETKEEIMVVLREVYGARIPNATDILIPKWYTDPLYRGSYTSTPFGLTQENRINLAQPEGNLYISGEGVSFEYNGYIHGAYCQGLITAKHILEVEGRSQSMSSLPSCPSAPSPAAKAVVKMNIEIAVLILIVMIFSL